jgi:uncharacterized ferritin-like protein (DUF455 family)
MLAIASVREKIHQAQRYCEDLFLSEPCLSHEILAAPLRDAVIAPAKTHPPKKGLSYVEGQARLLHDLANIELQAMELGYRSLAEFPDAPVGFREELLKITIQESQHLELCLNAIEKLGHQWGEWPIHLGLWQAVSAQDSLLDRILIVHRYLEGSGLDAGETLLRRLDSVNGVTLRPVLKTIFNDEVAHVEFGSRWYRAVCRQEKRDPQNDFPERMTRLRRVLPRRVEPISRPKRLAAGFDETEISYLENLRQSMI